MVSLLRSNLDVRLDVGRSPVCSLTGGESAGSSRGNGRTTAASSCSQEESGLSKNRATTTTTTTTTRVPESPPPPYVTPPGSMSRHFSVSGLASIDSNEHREYRYDRVFAE